MEVVQSAHSGRFPLALHCTNRKKKNKKKKKSTTRRRTPIHPSIVRGGPYFFFLLLLSSFFFLLWTSIMSVVRRRKGVGGHLSLLSSREWHCPVIPSRSIHFRATLNFFSFLFFCCCWHPSHRPIKQNGKTLYSLWFVVIRSSFSASTLFVFVYLFIYLFAKLSWELFLLNDGWSSRLISSNSLLLTPPTGYMPCDRRDSRSDSFTIWECCCCCCCGKCRPQNP